MSHIQVTGESPNHMGNPLLCKMSTFKRRIFPSSRKQQQQLNVA
ncbi:unnamed protein product [Brassica napus]|uniref:(rape) hypothetical protein n=1 Tax=Brassica napus TaxID=3708 RepID=A0A816Z546_BRANA|nr:unnamed protein product [Brassica napus]